MGDVLRCCHLIVFWNLSLIEEESLTEFGIQTLFLSLPVLMLNTVFPDAGIACTLDWVNVGFGVTIWAGRTEAVEVDEGDTGFVFSCVGFGWSFFHVASSCDTMNLRPMAEALNTEAFLPMV